MNLVLTRFKASFSSLQKIGKSLMLPVSVLPVAGILLGLGSSNLSWIPGPLSLVMAQAGGAIFGTLPLLFAIAVAVGMAGNDGVAALAATVGFMVLLATLGVMSQLMGIEPKLIMGMQSMDTGVFGGILVGALAAYLFKRYYKIELPTYLGFFAGKRFVPIVTAFAAIFLGAFLSVIWPVFQKGIDVMSHAAAYGNPTMAATIYGFVERLLIPFGLHHIWNVPFFVQIGEFVSKDGTVVHGDINRFFAGDPTAGILGGAYLFKMWGLPAAGLAMWHCAKPEQKAKVGSLMVSAGLASFLTGITEPLEFAFIFVAPLLYFVHAIFAGLGQLIFGLLGAKLGFTFSQGFIDYVLYYGLDTKPWLVLVFGPIFALIYYVTFRTMIVKLNLKTPGREDEATLAGGESVPQGSQSRGWNLIAAFGGRNNIQNLDACITRLRIDVKDINLLQEDRLKALGASGVLKVGNSAQAVFGPLSENLKLEMEDALKGPEPTAIVATNSSKALMDWVRALGGVANIKDISACATSRVRVDVKNRSQVNEKALQEAGVTGTMWVGENVLHLIAGPSAPADAQGLQQLLGSPTSGAGHSTLQSAPTLL